MTSHVRFTSLVSSRSGLFPGRAVSRLRPSGLWASPFIRRLARTSGRIEFLTYGPTDSPPVALHPTFGGHDSALPSVTQLPLAFNQSSVWLRGVPPPFQMRSRAHECGGHAAAPYRHESGGMATAVQIARGAREKSRPQRHPLPVAVEPNLSIHCSALSTHCSTPHLGTGVSLTTRWMNRVSDAPSPRIARRSFITMRCESTGPASRLTSSGITKSRPLTIASA